MKREQIPPPDVALCFNSHESPLSFHKHSCLLQIMESNESRLVTWSEPDDGRHMARPGSGAWPSLAVHSWHQGARGSRGCWQGKWMQIGKVEGRPKELGHRSAYHDPVMKHTYFANDGHLRRRLVAVVSQLEEFLPELLMMMLSDLGSAPARTTVG